MSSDKPLPFQYQFAAGAVAGVSEILVIQIQSATAVGDDAYNGMLDCFRKIIKNEGSESSYAILSPIAH
ncbi:mitochondrial 2-oxodicarboxylate transporter [Venturia nashicola]|uniref:Mitochondrial 2-oxodicarboxylate transporter n=1 Tax=Venturia nashicola TaxID=86259 RepID=A0A4Z1P4U0_9PEZI|nr:mitochondrial 2-oxodicarboxylate transporter [Venturia nashicola]